MAITSFICGIVGLTGIVYGLFVINIINEYSTIVSVDIMSYNSKLFLILFFIHILLSLLAIIFGFISGNKKIKQFSFTGRILGFIGMFLIIICTILSAMNNNEESHVRIYRPRPHYSYFTEIGIVETTTKDNFIVDVKIIIAYDPEDSVISLELSSRKDELRNFIKTYFNNKISSELIPENENLLKRDIKEILNTDILKNGNIRYILFDKIDIGYPY